jgi:hypothetical protein
MAGGCSELLQTCYKLLGSAAMQGVQLAALCGMVATMCLAVHASAQSATAKQAYIVTMLLLMHILCC